MYAPARGSVRTPPIGPLDLREHAAFDIATLIQLWVVSPRKQASSQIGYQVATGIREEAWPLMVEDAQKTRQKKPISVGEQLVAEHQSVPKCLGVKEAANPSWNCP
jgi:hypothetical protein